MSAQIKNICELLFELGAYDTVRKAQAAVKRGDVYVEDTRVANTDALLVIVHPTRISVKAGPVVDILTHGEIQYTAQP